MKVTHCRLSKAFILTIAILVCMGAPSLHAQKSDADSNDSPAITLTPAVIMVKAKPGQTFSQELTLWNNTIYELRFHMEAQDIVIRDGKRIFLPAGELEGGIARNAVFSNDDVLALPGSSATTHVTVTIPPSPGPRAIACVFMGKSPIETKNALTMTASLGALVTFTLANDYHIENQPLEVQIDPDAKMLTFRELVKNVGSDPIIPEGVIAVTNESGSLIARLPVTSQRLLPGESSEFTAEHPGLPKTGKYKVTLLMQNESALFSNAAEFTIK
jgi:hypothetical protein